MDAIARLDRPVQLYYVAVPPDFADMMNVEGPEREPTHAIDIAEFFETKLAAMACHSSQQDAREFFLMLAQRRLTTELFHRAMPAPEGSVLGNDLFA